MSSVLKPNEQDNGLEAAVDQAIAVCAGDQRATVRALIVANNHLESEIAELKKTVSHAYTRGRFRTYTG
jgi:tagatose-1,6-bisphosphate aldolase